MAEVVAVALRAGHSFSKTEAPVIRLLKGLGVEGDGHLGTTVQHRSRVARDPTQPNLRQVHLIHTELFGELRAKGFDVKPADLGENITTSNLDLLALPTGTKLHLGDTAVIEITGLRNPCLQIDAFRKGLMAATLDKDPEGNLIRKAGVMAVVLADGDVRPGDAITVTLPTGEHRPLVAV